MGSLRVNRVVVMAGACLALSCWGDPTGLSSPGDLPRVRLRVTGGLAGADYAVVLNGSSGELVGESCKRLCDFKAGETLQFLAAAQVSYLAGLFRNAGVLYLDDRDFGDQCCDQFHYAVRYQEGGQEHRFQGSSQALPPTLGEAVAALHGLVSGTLPVVVDPATRPESWPRDPFQMGTTRVGGDLLEIAVTFAGGCRTHAFRVVAWGGWMESYPVQLRLFLSHEDAGDPCKALLSRGLRFDLGPVKKAYQAAYGIGEPGKTTVVLLLEDPLLMSPLGSRRLEYVF
jgi:hypothetical protein